MTQQRTRQEIEAEVEELAVEVVLKQDPDLSIEAARSIVWEEADELYDEYQAAPHGMSVEVIAKVEREPTLGEAIHRVVLKKAAQLAWTEWPTKTLQDLELDVWQTPEGAALYNLYTSPEAKLPMSSVEHQFRKRHLGDGDDAWSVLRRWLVG